MYKGKYNKRKAARSKKPLLVLASLVLVLAMGIAGVSAFITTQSGKVENTFTLDEVPPVIMETEPNEENNYVKSNVSVKLDNTDGNTEPAYVRAVVVVNWVSTTNHSEINPTVPVKDTDYFITLNLGQSGTENCWVQGDDGYYYYTSPVAAGGSTGILIDECKVIGTPPAGYTLSVEILAQTIQADGVDANGKTPVELAWGEHAASLVK